MIEYFHVQHYAKTRDAGTDYDSSMAQLWCSGFTPINWYTALRSRSIILKNTKNKLQATDFTPAGSNLAKDSDSKITAKCYCPDPCRFLSARFSVRIQSDAFAIEQALKYCLFRKGYRVRFLSGETASSFGKSNFKIDQRAGRHRGLNP